ncbi:hypothetical protein SDC9_15107 [bioreactor metagenome]|uniref:DUF4143 domain-containing protein n=1 Tax=bioreactor metagenome TaxID=1076179 RepID=A0A644TSB9_9ZZZZ
MFSHSPLVFLLAECLLDNFHHVIKPVQTVQCYLDIVFYLHPYSNNMLKRMVTKPKLYFYDCGLVAYLTKWSNSDTLMNGAMSGAILENFVVSEIVKSYHNCACEAYIYYYRDKDTKELDILGVLNKATLE